jgi:homoserine O-acetyltransferase/O-succinyltransferase
MDFNIAKAYTTEGSGLGEDGLTDLLPKRPTPKDPKQEFRIKPGLLLEQGAYLLEPKVTYHTYGDPDKPVIWVCHALTANSDVFDWWAGLFGEHDLFNPRDYFIVCANILGSCYGTEGPLENHSYTGEPYYHDFPQITVRDFVAAHEALRLHLGIGQIELLLGGSLGGQQALEWAVQQPEVFKNMAVIATNARHSAWGIAFNEAQRMAIRADTTWKEQHPLAGDAGMRAARATALLSYRHYQTYASAQTDIEPVLTDYRAVTYQQYQGEKLSKRFNAFSYFRLSEAMDSHHLGRGRESVEAALGAITAKTLVLGIDTDVLFPPSEQRFIADHIPGAAFEMINSIHGHDGFLIETAKLTELMRDFLR